MPADRCVVRYKCDNCGETLSPKPGDCCVFCSYGSQKCPPIQQAQSDSSPAGDDARRTND
jgi:hypothetical protein